MKINYILTESKKNDTEAGNQIGYGLMCVCGEERLVAEDISPDRAAVERMAELLEREGVEPVHFMDVLSDLLAEHAAEL